MFDEPGDGLAYQVITDELIRASDAVAQITSSANAGLVEALPTLASTLGHDRLQATLTDFCARWDTGLSHLVGDGEAMSQRLTGCATTYLDNEDLAAEGYERLNLCAPAPRSVWPPDAFTPFSTPVLKAPPFRLGGS